MSPLERVRQYVRQHALFDAGTAVVVAVSGGSDSVALAALLHALAAGGEVRLAGLAHFNHQLRDAALGDEEFAASVARALDVPFVADRGDVPGRARREKRSLEDAARAARYEFLERARRECHADVVALGHTRDDQAETFLLRLLRGAGPRGCAAMRPRRGAFVRPVLDCRRAELRAYVAERGLTYVEDDSNMDVSIPRNRVRAELLPLLADRFNPGIVDVLAREAELAREVWVWLDSEADAFEKGVGSPDPLSRELDAARLEAAPPALRRLVVWRAMSAIAGSRPVSFEQVERALAVLAGEGAAADGPGQRVHRLGARLVLTRRGEASRVNLFEYPLSIPGEVQLAEAGCVVAAEVGRSAADAEAGAQSGRGRVAFVRRDLCPGPIRVRNRRPGDRFRPVGVGGWKKLQDYFVDRKVPAAKRDAVPVVVDQSDRIVWVAGYGIDEAFRVMDASQSVLLLRLRQV